MRPAVVGGAAPGSGMPCYESPPAPLCSAMWSKTSVGGTADALADADSIVTE